MFTRRWLFGLFTLPFARPVRSFEFGGIEFAVYANEVEALREFGRNWTAETYCDLRLAVSRR
jgi:hypothetical protein